MKLVVAGLFAVAVAGFTLTHVTPGQAQSRADWCDKAAKCANRALNERFDADNPGMGKKFRAKKAECQVYSRKCNGG